MSTISITNRLFIKNPYQDAVSDYVAIWNPETKEIGWVSKSALFYDSAPEHNKITSETGLSLVGNMLTIFPNWTWLIKKVNYSNVSNIIFNIPITSAPGMKRTDIIVANNANGFTRLVGEESPTNPVAPPVLQPGLVATVVQIEYDSITVSEPDLSHYATTEYVNTQLLLKLDRDGYNGTGKILDERITVLENVQNLKTNFTGKAYAIWTGVGMTFDVIYPDYYIQGVLYPGATEQIILIPSDPTDPRLDIIAVDATGAIQLNGEPAPAPSSPTIDPETQIYITTVLIGAGSTTPTGVGSEDVYKENTEWLGASNIGTANFNSTSNPFQGTKHIDCGSFTNNQYLRFTDSVVNQTTDYTLLKFYVNLKAVFSNSTKFSVKIFNGTTQISSTIVISSGFYGFDRNIINTYQTIIIPLSDFTFTNASFDRVEIVMVGANASGFRMDNISLVQNSDSSSPEQKAITTIITDSGIANATIKDDTFQFRGIGGLIVSAVGKVISFTVALTDYYTKTEIDAKLSGAYIFKGNKTDYADLVATGEHVNGYVYNLLDTSKNYAWNGTDWDDIGGTFDISGKEDIANKTDDIETNKTSSIKYVSAKGIWDWAVAKFVQITNIKTVNNVSLIGTGNVSIPNPAQTKTLFISSTGNNATAIINDRDFPFQTLLGAISALPADDGSFYTLCFISSGTFTGCSLPARNLNWTSDYAVIIDFSGINAVAQDSGVVNGAIVIGSAGTYNFEDGNITLYSNTPTLQQCFCLSTLKLTGWLGKFDWKSLTSTHQTGYTQLRSATTTLQIDYLKLTSVMTNNNPFFFEANSNINIKKMELVFSSGSFRSYCGMTSGQIIDIGELIFTGNSSWNTWDTGTINVRKISGTGTFNMMGLTHNFIDCVVSATVSVKNSGAIISGKMTGVSITQGGWVMNNTVYRNFTGSVGSHSPNQGTCYVYFKGHNYISVSGTIITANANFGGIIIEDGVTVIDTSTPTTALVSGVTSQVMTMKGVLTTNALTLGIPLVRTINPVDLQIKDNQIEVGANSNVLNAWNGQTILFTANCTITVPATLDNSLMFAFRTLAGVTVTWAITAPFTWEATPGSITEKTVGHFMRRGSTNTIILDM